MKKEFHEKIFRILDEGCVLENEAMSRHTTFRIGGDADYFVRPKTISQMQQVILLCNEHEMPFLVIGNGSNLLFSDKGYRGVVIQYFAKKPLVIDEEAVTAGADLLLPQISMEAAEHSLAGAEFLAGIPGSLGGAAAMNAGAYGREMKDIVTGILALDRQGKEIRLGREELCFSYRHSIIQEKELIVLEASFLLHKGNKKEIYEKMEELNRMRREKQPLQYPSAGSAFKRPEGYYAGKLVMDAGLSGYQVGGAAVSEKHCGFVINKGGATAQDIYQLLADVAQIVKDKFGVSLEPEIKLIGDFS